MNAKIIDEDDRGLGVRTIDNNGVEHTVALGFDGDAQGHSQDGYPDDASEREPAEGQNVMQARNYARFYVARERGYDTITEGENPDRINAVRHALADLSNEEFLTLFDDYYRQHRSHYDDTVTQPVSLPGDIGEDDFFQYELGVYLDIDQNRLEAKAADLSDLLTDAALEQSPDTLERVQQVLSDGGRTKTLSGETVARLNEKANEQDLDFSDIVTIDAISGVHVMWQDEVGLVNKRIEDRRQLGDVPYEREPDALIQLPPIDVTDLDDDAAVTEFKEFLCYHLQCQVRDCFVGMGIDPPREFHVVGPGKYKYTIRYRQLDFYPDLHELHPDAVDFERWDEEGLIETSS